MHHVVLVAIVQSTPYLPRELACDPLPQSTMTDDVVEHLAPANVLEDHVVVVLVDDHLTHAANVGVVEEHRQRGLADGANLLGRILGRLLGRRFRRRGGPRPTGRYTGQDFHRELMRTLHSGTDGHRSSGRSPSRP